MFDLIISRAPNEKKVGLNNMIKSTIIFLVTLFLCPLIAQQFSGNYTKSDNERNYLHQYKNLHFTSLATKDHIILKWIDKSDKPIAGFKILRSETEKGNYVLISSYESNPNLNCQSNQAKQNQFSFVDLAVVPGITYWYKINCIDENKNFIEYGPISASLPVHQYSDKIFTTSPTKFRFVPIRNNKIQSSTMLQLDLPYYIESNHPANISIYGPKGERVKTIYKGFMEPGSYQLIWNGDTEKGDIVTEGVFFVVFENDVVREATKVILIK